MPASSAIRSLAAVFLVVAIPNLAIAQEGIQPEDYYKTIFVSQPEISPNGDLIAFTRTIIKEEDNERHREVWMQKLRDGEPNGEPFRFTDPSVPSSSPRWSPDGELLSIQSRRGDDSNTIRFLRVTAPGGEAFQLEGVDRSPTWAPDGSQIAFVREPEQEDEEREERDLYRELSPLSYVENVDDPTLIIHSEEDYRTPIVEGEQWFMALKKRQVPVEFVRYPRSSHGLSRTGEPWLLVDRLERLRSWFDYWLVQENAATTAE